MKAPTLLVDGVGVQLGKRIGRGGEGEVFALENDLERVLKIYTSTHDSQQREAKINSIVNRKIALQSSLVAFPLAIARRTDGQFAGFVMKRVDGHKPIFELYSPGARKKNFPRADFRFLVRTAANVSRAVASVHRTGCVIGDINHSGILVSDGAKVALIDADSFQIADGANNYLCRVGVPEYTPPELQGKKLSTIVRTANHDAFGLAVVIFQLLFMGRHPFVGAFAKGDMPMERAIFEHRFAYSRIRDVGMTRPPGAASLGDFPSYVADAFEQAFSPNSVRRPTAEAWIDILSKLESAIIQCDDDILHYYPQAAKECPWCRMERKLGMQLFLPNFLNRNGATFDPGAASFILADAWAAIEKVIVPQSSQLNPVFPQIKFVPSVEAKKAKHEFYKSRAIGTAVFVLAILIACKLPTCWFLWLPTLLFAAKKMFLIKVQSEQLFLDRNADAAAQLEKVIDAWRTKAGINQVFTAKTSLAQAKQQLLNIEREKPLRISVYQSKRPGIQLLKYMESHEIRKAKIRHVGLARQTALASYGIETALDITDTNVLQVPGFGANNSVPLIEWKKSVEKQFVYDPKPNELDQEELQKIKFELDQKGSEYRKILTSGPADLELLIKAIGQRAQKQDPAIAKAYAEYCRTKGDLRYLGIDSQAKTAKPARGISGLLSKSGNKLTPSAAAKYSNQTLSTTPGAYTPNTSRPYSGTANGVTPPRNSNATTPRSTSQPASRSASTTVPSNSNASVRCPKCGQGTVQMTVRRGPRAGEVYYECAAYPACDGQIRARR